MWLPWLWKCVVVINFVAHHAHVCMLVLICRNGDDYDDDDAPHYKRSQRSFHLNLFEKWLHFETSFQISGNVQSVSTFLLHFFHIFSIFYESFNFLNISLFSSERRVKWLQLINSIKCVTKQYVFCDCNIFFFFWTTIKIIIIIINM